MSTLEVCEKYYGTKNIYELFGVEKSASDQEIKKAYYRLSLQTHPDRVPESDKQEATEKFKVLSKLYNILSNKDSRAIYDERGTVDDDDNASTNWLARWQQFFKPLTTEDIDNYQKSYVGSETERNDIKRAYLRGKGCKNSMMCTVPFMQCEDEPRIAAIVQEMIDSKEVPEYKIFTNEPEAKRKQRHKKYAREAKMASQMKKKQDDTSSLEQQIALKRKSAFSSLIESLEAKYGNNDDDSDELYQSEEEPPKKRKMQQAKRNVRQSTKTAPKKPVSAKKRKSSK
ncbi:AGAP004849-PA [Anopheles gambiae str. PEST]|uniref:AGAP004849-PA n=2 Tax=gambiae species complex TaxID=44542 RepID=Q7Q952_ANOGA|nr:J domain-containing protein CG6693 [Anopheles gambiae]EAA09682.3 AGAP004849-PA [Anopheles gambiae str. PEST]